MIPKNIHVEVFQETSFVLHKSGRYVNYIAPRLAQHRLGSFRHPAIYREIDIRNITRPCNHQMSTGLQTARGQIGGHLRIALLLRSGGRTPRARRTRRAGHKLLEPAAGPSSPHVLRVVCAKTDSPPSALLYLLGTQGRSF